MGMRIVNGEIVRDDDEAGPNSGAAARQPAASGPGASNAAERDRPLRIADGPVDPLVRIPNLIVLSHRVKGRHVACVALCAVSLCFGWRAGLGAAALLAIYAASNADSGAAAASSSGAPTTGQHQAPPTYNGGVSGTVHERAPSRQPDARGTQPSPDKARFPGKPHKLNE